MHCACGPPGGLLTVLHCMFSLFERGFKYKHKWRSSVIETANQALAPASMCGVLQSCCCAATLASTHLVLQTPIATLNLHRTRHMRVELSSSVLHILKATMLLSIIDCIALQLYVTGTCSASMSRSRPITLQMCTYMLRITV